MKLIHDMVSLRAERKQWVGQVGFVPTMGALHEGHLELVRVACSTADHVVVSIFVNPTQFNDPSDLAKYPRTLEHDLALLEPYPVEAVFFPSSDWMYPHDFQTWVEVQDDNSGSKIAQSCSSGCNVIGTKRCPTSGNLTTHDT